MIKDLVDAEILLSLENIATEKNYKRNEYIIKQGEQLNKFYIIKNVFQINFVLIIIIKKLLLN